MAELTLSNYLGMLQEDPDSQEALEGVRRAVASGDAAQIGAGGDPVRWLEAARARHEARGELGAVLALLEIEVELVEGDPALAAALWKAIGRLREEERFDGEGALQAWRRALELHPEDEEAEEAVERLESTAERWRAIADRFVQEASDATDARLAASLYARAASVVWQHKKKGAAKEARKLFDKAVEAMPGEERVARLYANFLERRKKWKDAAAVLERAAESAEQEEARRRCLLRAARLRARRAKDPDGAERDYRALLDVEPAHAEALGFLVQRLTEREAWDELASLYERALEHERDEEERLGMLTQLGMVHWRFRGDPGAAEPYFAALRRARPDHPGALSFFAERIGDDAEQQVELLAEALRAAPEAGKPELARKLGRVAQHLPGALERAVDAWKLVLRHEPNDEEAHEALEGLYRRTGKWNALVELLRAELERTPPERKDRRVALLRQLVEVYRDHLGLDAMVVQTYRALLRELPEDRRAMEELAALYERIGRWNDLVQLLQRLAESEPDPERRVTLWLRVARVWIERFSNYSQASKALEAVIQVDPEHREALGLLKDIYRRRRAWAQLYEVLGKEVARASDPAVRLELQIERAHLAAERLRRMKEAIALWREVLAEKPDVEGGLTLLERLAEREKDWATLAETLERRLERERDPAQRVRVLQKLGSVYGDYLEDAERAESAWRRILEIEPGHGRALRTLRDGYLARRDWDGLEALYARSEDWEGLVDVLGAAAERAEEEDAKVELSFRAARVYEERIGEPHRAFRNYERILAVRPAEVRAARALVPIYEREEKWPRLAKVLELLLEHDAEASVQERVAILRRLTEIAWERLRDARRALGYARAAFELDPTNPDALQVLEVAAERARAQEELPAIWLARVEASEDTEERIRLRDKAARLYEERLGAPERAAEVLAASVTERPDDEELAARYETLLERLGQWERLRERLRERLEATEEESERLNLLRRLGRIEAERLGESDSAVARWQEVLRLRPEDVEALEALDGLLRGLERWEELAEVIDARRILACEEVERAMLSCRLAGLCLDRLGRAEVALGAYRDALEAVPGFEEAVIGLERIEAEFPELALEAGRVLEPVYETRRAFEKLRRLLERRLEEGSDEAERRELRLRLADLASRELGDAEGAFRALERAFLEHPDDEELLDRLQEAAEAAQVQEAFVRALDQALGMEGLEEEAVLRLTRRAAAVYQEQLGRPAEAEPYLRRVLSLEPQDEPAFVALKDLATEQERWDELRSLYAERIERSEDPAVRRELFLQLAFLLEEIVEDVEGAIEAYEGVLQLDPEEPGSRRALVRLYRRAERWEPLVELLRAELDRVDGYERTELGFEIAELLEHRLGEREEAVAAYERVLEENPTYLKAQEALDRLLGDKAVRGRVAAFLEPIYEEQGAWQELGRVLEVRYEVAGGPDERAELALRLADLYENRLGEPDRAFGAVERALVHRPEDAAIRERLAAMARGPDGARRRAAALQDAVRSLADAPRDRADVMLELGEVLLREVGDVDRAEEVYQQLVRDASDRPEVLVTAARALEEIHLDRGAWEPLAEDLRLQARWADDPAERSALLERLATVLEERLDDVDGALAVHLERLEADPTDRSALRALERLHERKEQWEELVDVLRAREAASDDPEEQLAVLRRVAQVQEERLGQPEDALSTYEEVLSRFGERREVFAELVRLYEVCGRHAELLDALEAAERVAEEPTERLALRHRQAELLRGALGEPLRAIEVLQAVLEEEPEHSGALEALETLASEGETEARLAAARALVPRYESAGAYAELLRALGVLAEVGDPEERLLALRRAAEVAEVGLDDAGRAFELVARALRLDLNDEERRPLIGELERLAEASQRWREYAETLAAVSADLLDVDLQIEAATRAADAWAERVGDLDAAVSVYRKLLQEHPAHRPSLEALQRLLEGAGRHVELLDVLERKTELVDTPEERVALLLRRARLAEEDLADVAGAIDALEQALLEGEPAEAFERLERLYGRAERWEDLARLYERWMDAAVGDPTEVRARLGRLWLERLGDPERALDLFSEVLAERRGHPATVEALEGLLRDERHRVAAAERLEDVYLARMDWPRLVAVLEVRLADEQDPVERRELLQRLGEIHEDHLEDLEGAFERYALLFREDPRDEEALERIQRLARVLENWPRFAEVLVDALAEVSFDDEQTVAIARMAAELYEERVGDPSRAADLYRRVLAYEPSDRTAFDALERVLRQTERWEELLEHYRKGAQEAEDDEERAERLRLAARLQRERLRDRDGAIETWREVLRIDPADAEALDVLDELLSDAKRWAELAEHLRHRLEETHDPDRRVELEVRLARLLADRLEDREGAVDVLEELLVREPGHEAAVTLLEALVLDSSLRGRVVDLLEPIYRAQDEWKKLVAVLEARVEDGSDPYERAEWLAEVARLHEERGGDPASAMNAWARALLARPEESSALEELERLAGQVQAWDAYVATLEEAIERSGSPDVEAELLMRMARVHDARRGDPRAAIEAYEAVLRRQPDHEGALEALEMLRTMVADWPGLVAVLRRKAELALEPAERGALWRRIGSVQEDLLEAPEQAIESYRMALLEDDADLDALEALDDLYTRQERWSELEEILQRRIELADASEERVTLGLRRAELCERLERFQDAIDAFVRVLEEEPGHLGAAEALGRLYEHEGMWPELLENLRLRAGLVEDPAERIALQVRVGDLLRERLGEPVEAVAAYGRTLELDPRYEPAVGALLALAQQEASREAAIEVVEPVLHVQERWDDLARIVALRAESAFEPERKRDEYVRLAEIHEHGRQDPSAAFDALARAFEEDPGSEELLGRLELLAERTGRWGDLADLLQQRGEAVFEPEVGRRLLERLAEVSESRLQDLNRAVAAIDRALDLVGEDEALLARLQGLLERAERWDELGRVLERRLAATEDPSVLDDLYVALGRLRLQRLGDAVGAMEAYREVLERNPAHEASAEATLELVERPEVAEEAVDVLDHVFRETGRLDRVAELTERRIALAAEDGDRVALLLQAADLWERELARPDRAASAVARAVAIDPRDADLVERLEQLCAESGHWEAVRGLVEGLQEADALDDELLGALSLRAARWYRDGLGDPSAAEARFRAALAADPGNREAFEGLDALLAEPGRERDRAELQMRWATMEAGAARAERLGIAADLAEVAGAVDLAIEAHRARLDAAPGQLDSLEALARLYEASGRWEEAVEALQRLAAASGEDGGARADWLRHAAKLLEERIADPGRATAVWEAVCEAAPGDEEAEGALERLYQAQQRWEPLRDLLLARLQRAPSVALRERIAQLALEALGEPSLAIEQLEGILQEEPGHEEAAARLLDLLERSERWEALAERLQERAEWAEAAGDTLGAAAHYERLAALRHERLADRAGAIAAMRRVAALRPEAVEPWRRIEAWARDAGDPETVAEALERQAAGLPAEQGASVAASLAKLLEEELGELDRAEAVLRKRVELTNDEGARADLRAFLERHERWDALAELLAADIDLIEEGETRLQRLRELAALHERRGDPAAAAEALERAAALAPEDREILRPLCDFYIAAGREADAVPVLERIVASFGKRRSKELASYQHRLGQALEGLGRVEEALQYYDAAFRVDLTNVAVLRDLGRLSHARGDLNKAQKHFRALLLHRLGPETGIAKADVYAYLGDIALQQGDRAKARSMLERAVAEQPGHEWATELLARVQEG